MQTLLYPCEPHPIRRSVPLQYQLFLGTALASIRVNLCRPSHGTRLLPHTVGQHTRIKLSHYGTDTHVMQGAVTSAHGEQSIRP